MMWKNLGLCLLASATLAAAMLGSATPAQSRPRWDTFSDTWVATDGLKRELPTSGKVGAPRAKKQIAIFYFLWMGEHASSGPFDISKILKQDPTALSKPKNASWGPEGVFHFWAEPRFGYYNTDDLWVVKKHAQMLSDAGVDLILMDNTNNVTYTKYYMAVLKGFSEVRAMGGKTPQVAFICPFGDPTYSVTQMWENLYSKGLYKDLWYQLDGKPLILADLEAVNIGFGNDNRNNAEVLKSGSSLGQSFKTTVPFMAVSAFIPTWGTRGSGFTMKLFRGEPGGELLAQQKYTNVKDNQMVQLQVPKALPVGDYTIQISNPVGTIGWWSHTDDVYKDGQAYANGKAAAGDRVFRVIPESSDGLKIRQFFTARKPMPGYFTGPSGPNQWGWLEIYPQHVFKNSRGESEMVCVGIAQNAADGKLDAMTHPRSLGRSYQKGTLPKDTSKTAYGLNFTEQWNRALKLDPQFVFVTGWNEWIAQRFTASNGTVMFVDQFDMEHSRDIEPMKGGYGDAYYYQFVNYARQFKGARPIPVAGKPKPISLMAGFAQWGDVKPEFRDDNGDVSHRDHPGYNNFTVYRNETGRNDIVVAKLSRDSQNLSFYVRCQQPISLPVGAIRWMQLYLDVDKKHTNGWNGYDFRLNGVVLNDAAGPYIVLERCLDGWKWKAVAKVRLNLNGKELMVQIPRKVLGLSSKDKGLSVDFKWVDNALKTGDILELLEDGDTAPNARFNYRYQVK